MIRSQQIVTKTKKLRKQHKRTQLPGQSILDRVREGKIDVCYRQFACQRLVEKNTRAEAGTSEWLRQEMYTQILFCKRSILQTFSRETNGNHNFHGTAQQTERLPNRKPIP